MEKHKTNFFQTNQKQILGGGDKNQKQTYFANFFSFDIKIKWQLPKYILCQIIEMLDLSTDFKLVLIGERDC